LSRLCTLALVVALAGCQHFRPIGEDEPGGSGAALEVQAARDPGAAGFRFGIGDALEVRVYREPELSGEFMISADGAIQFPLAGPIVAVGATAPEVAARITEALAGRYLRDPQVTVLLKDVQSRKVSVLGQVEDPGTFVYQESMTLVEAVSKAGGLGKLAQPQRVKITRIRDGGEQTFVVDLERVLDGRAPNLVLQAGDVVFVPESLF